MDNTTNNPNLSPFSKMNPGGGLWSTPPTPSFGGAAAMPPIPTPVNPPAASGTKTGGSTVHPMDLPRMEAAGGVQQDKNSKDVNLKMIMDVPIEVHVEVGQAQLPIREVLKLGIGSIVELDRTAGAPADIVVNGKLIGHGEVVVVDDSFGVRITRLVDPEERLESL